MDSLDAALASRDYPGRGLLLARSRADGLGVVYFLTGRSTASRQRRLQVCGDGDIAVVDTSASGQHDALRHYVAAARRGSWLVVGNGDQVVPLAEGLAAGASAVRTWQQPTVEPDPPVFTSRIWAAHQRGSGTDGILGWARRSGRGDGGVDRAAWSLETVTAGTGVLMTTYDGDRAAVSATAAPTDVSISARTLPDVLARVWAALAPELRVAAFVVSASDPSAAPVVTPPLRWATASCGLRQGGTGSAS